MYLHDRFNVEWPQAYVLARIKIASVSPLGRFVLCRVCEDKIYGVCVPLKDEDTAENRKRYYINRSLPREGLFMISKDVVYSEIRETMG